MNGLDHLGLANRNYPIKKVIKYAPKGCAIGVFWDTFGPVTKPLKQCLASGKFAACRIHIWWSYRHVIAPVSAVKRACIAIEKLAGEYPFIKFYVSHSCEHDEKNKATVQKRIDVIRRFAPSCIPVNCIGKGTTLPGVINESHPHQGKSSLKPPYIASNDGRDINDMNGPKYVSDHKDAELCFVWASRFNLRDPEESSPPPPKLRTKAPSDALLKYTAELIR